MNCDRLIEAPEPGGTGPTHPTEQSPAERRQALVASIAESAAEGLLICDPANRIVWVNRAFSEITGYAAAEVIGKTPRILRSGVQDDGFYVRLRDCLRSSGEWQGKVIDRRKDGSLFPAWLHLQALPYNGHHVGMLADLSTGGHPARGLYHLAYFDAVTGLPNRKLFYEHLRRSCLDAAGRGAQVAVLLVDLDHFKEVNDDYGHEYGDTVLKRAGSRLAACLRDEDLLARFDGDGFAAVVAGIGGAPEIAGLATRMCAVLAPPTSLDGPGAYVTASIGISLFPGDANGATSLIRLAEVAMYDAKGCGGNGHRFFDDRFNRDNTADAAPDD